MITPAVHSDDWDGRQTLTQLVECVECGRPSSGRWDRWRACRTDLPDTDDPPAVAFYCPTCAAREFD
jgi:hypothetical protein